MDSSINSSSDSDEKLTLESIDPTLRDPYPLELKLTPFLPPLKVLKLPPIAKSQLKLLINHPIVKKLHHLLFWLVFYKELKPETNSYLQEKTSEKLSKSYTKLMIFNMKSKIDLGLEYLPFLIAYAIHHELYDLFKYSHHVFDKRFIVDCYKIIFQELLGLIVTDSFILSSVKRLYGEYFLKYTRKVKVKPEAAAGALNKGLEKQMERIPGGIEFAKELAGKLRPALSKVEYTTNEEIVKLTVSDNIIAERVHRHLSVPLLKRSSVSESVKVFNCNKLSPLLSRQMQSSTKNIPYKKRHLTPHKVEEMEKQPDYLSVLKKYCEDKRKNFGVRIKKIPKEGKVAIKQNSVNNVEIDSKGPEHSSCFSEVFKLQSQLNEVKPRELLFVMRKTSVL